MYIHIHIYIYIYMYIYIYIYIYICIARICSHLRKPESNFAICFLLEIPMTGFPFQMRLFEKYRIPKNYTNTVFQRISFEKDIPSWGSQAANLSQTSHPIASPRRPGVWLFSCTCS